MPPRPPKGRGGNRGAFAFRSRSVFARIAQQHNDDRSGEVLNTSREQGVPGNCASASRRTNAYTGASTGPARSIMRGNGALGAPGHWIETAWRTPSISRAVTGVMSIALFQP